MTKRLRWSINYISDTQVNQTTAGNQMYSSVAMAYDGSFTIVWSGNGTQTNQQDSSGVFYRQYNADFSSGRHRERNPVELDGAGVQQYPSIASDADGNCVVIWTGPDATTPSTTDVFSARSLPAGSSKAGPIVTDVLQPDVSNGTHVLDHLVNGAHPAAGARPYQTGRCVRREHGRTRHRRAPGPNMPTAC